MCCIYREDCVCIYREDCVDIYREDCVVYIERTVLYI